MEGGLKCFIFEKVSHITLQCSLGQHLLTKYTNISVEKIFNNFQLLKLFEFRNEYMGLWTLVKDLIQREKY